VASAEAAGISTEDAVANIVEMSKAQSEQA